MADAPRVLVVDLNNFARYPTVAVGYITAILRRSRFEVEVFSPLAMGVSGVVREPRPRPWGLIDQRLRYWSAVSRSPVVRRMRASIAKLHQPKLARHAQRVVRLFEQRLNESHFDAVLVSTYLLYHPICTAIGRICAERDLPLLIGGAYFSQPEVVEQWCDIEGLRGIVTGEVEAQLPQIVTAIIHGHELNDLDGVHVPGQPWRGPAPPLRELDSLPFPDYSDFPWEKYPNRIIPMVSGRGCAWGACTFCSDVTSTAGRTFRSRTPENVLSEINCQSKRHGADMFVFTDLKLNSNLSMWNALLAAFPTIVPKARWIASVHVGAAHPNGLSFAELKAARAAGMVRLTTGLESGSQRVLRSMGKGTDLAMTSRCLRHAAQAGISVRTTMILGYPGEEADDVEQSAAFLQRHADCIERVSVNRFLIMSGTRFHRRMEKSPQAFAGVTPLTVDHRLAQIEHHYDQTQNRDYRGAVRRLLKAAHQINRRPLSPAARDFEGVM